MLQAMAETVKPLLQQILQTALGGMLGGLQRTQNTPGQELDVSGQTDTHDQTVTPGQDSHEGSQDKWGVLPENVTPISEEDDIDV